MTKEQNEDELDKLNALLTKENKLQLMAFAQRLLEEQQGISQGSEELEENDSN